MIRILINACLADNAEKVADLIAHVKRHTRELRRRHRAKLLDEGPPRRSAAAPHPEPTDGALTAAEDTPRLGLHPVQQRADGHFRHGDREHPLAAEPAAELAGTA